MSTVPLFGDRHRDDDGYRRPDETTYAFLDRVSRPNFAAPRGMLNAWFERWPADDREPLRKRLMGKQPSDFDGAFWELYPTRCTTDSASRSRASPRSPG